MPPWPAFGRSRLRLIVFIRWFSFLFVNVLVNANENHYHLCIEIYNITALAQMTGEPKLTMPDKTATDTEVKSPSLEVLMASIFYLMTRHAIRPDTSIANAIVDHLDMLARHTDCDSHVWRRAGERLSSQWQYCVKAAASAKTYQLHPEQTVPGGHGKLH